MKYSELIRRQLLSQMHKDDNILDALHRQEVELGEIHRKVSQQSWLSDFSSNLAGNAVWDGLVWIGSRLIRKL